MCKQRLCRKNVAKLAILIVLTVNACATGGTKSPEPPAVPAPEAETQPTNEDKGPPAGADQPSRAQAQVTLAKFEEKVALARGSVGKLSKLSWTKLRLSAGETLALLAEAIDAAPADTGVATAALLAEIRFQAERLRRPSSGGFGQAGWIKTGLLKVLDGIEAISGGRAAVVAPWLRVAREVAQAIDGDSAVAFQRPMIQDGFRTAVDALVISSLPETCR